MTPIERYHTALAELGQILAAVDAKFASLLDTITQRGRTGPYKESRDRIAAGFRRGVFDKDVALVESAARAMRALADLARAQLLDANTGRPRSIPEEVAATWSKETAKKARDLADSFPPVLDYLCYVGIAAALGAVVLVGAFVYPHVKGALR